MGSREALSLPASAASKVVQHPLGASFSSPSRHPNPNPNPNPKPHRCDLHKNESKLSPLPTHTHPHQHTPTHTPSPSSLRPSHRPRIGHASNANGNVALSYLKAVSNSNLLERIPKPAAGAGAGAGEGLEDAQEFKALLDPITLDVIQDPVVAADGNTYDRSAITLWFDTCRADGRAITSPMTDEPLHSTELLPNHALLNLIEKLRERLSQEQVSSPHSHPTLRSVYTGMCGASQMLSSDMITDMDALIGMGFVDELKLRPPRLVALGNESHGKSTVLERLIGLPIFPRDRGLCTRCPIRVHLQRNIASLTTIHVQKVGNTQHTTSADVSPPRQHVALERLGQVLSSMMDDMVSNSGLDIIDDQEIVVHIQVPYCPNLDILDLPGLAAAKRDGSKQDLPRATLELARTVIEREKHNSIFLLVVDIRVPTNLSLAAELVRSCNIEDRTVGVFTKLDVFRSETDDDYAVHEILGATQPSSLRLSLGWLACSSRLPPKSKVTSRKMDHLIEMEFMEQNFLANYHAELAQGGLVGMKVVRTKVQILFEAFLCEHWAPRLRDYLTDRLHALRNANTDLGLPIAQNPVYSDILSQLSRTLPDCLRDGDVSFLTVIDEHEWTKLLNERARKVISDSNWSTFDTCGVWDLVKSFSRKVEEFKFEFKRSPLENGPQLKWIPFEQGTSVVMAAEQTITDALTEIIAALHAFGIAHMHGRFNESFQGSEVRFESVHTAPVCLARLPELCEHVSDRLRAKLFDASETFKSESMRWLSDLRVRPSVLVERKFSSEGGCSCLLSWADRVDTLPHCIIGMWVDTVVHPMHSFVADIEVASSGPLLNESCYEERLQILREMHNIVHAFGSLERLHVRTPRY